LHSRSNMGIGVITKIFIIVFCFVVLLSLALWVAITNIPSAPIIEVSGVSLNPNTINQNEFSTLSFTIKNTDASSLHQVSVEFNTTTVTFNINSQNLTINPSDGLQYYPITLQSSQQSTYSFKVFGTLTGGAKSSTYSIPFYFFYENGTKFDTETVSLTVNS
jgi:hypothetical protein